MRQALLLCLLLLPLSRAPALAQVAVAPTFLVLSDRERVGTFLVRNDTGDEQEVTIDFRFGYPVSDSAGRRSMVYGDTLAGRDRAMTSWLRAFPRQFSLPPGEQQIVRLVATVPGDLAEGMYWTRLVTTSMLRNPPVDSATTSGVRAQFNVRLEQITTVLFRRGAVSTALTAGELEVAVDSEYVQIRAPLRQTGSSPYLGTFVLRVLDEQGSIVAEDTALDAVYFEMVRGYALPRPGLKPGRYTVEFSATAERSDIPREALPPGEPVSRRAQFILP